MITCMCSGSIIRLHVRMRIKQQRTKTWQSNNHTHWHLSSSVGLEFLWAWSCLSMQTMEKWGLELGGIYWRCGLQGQTGTELVDRPSCRTLQRDALWEEARFSGIADWTGNLYVITSERATPSMGTQPTSSVRGVKEVIMFIACETSTNTAIFWWGGHVKCGNTCGSKLYTQRFLFLSAECPSRQIKYVVLSLTNRGKPGLL